ncbi:DUF2934 domain-containing protein [Rhodoligotrophos ferricapiens]|uniref:DUF2934 domain-containing protein n=1 Tax=Rhodoligotrophos ferricapiens TaxID=3069264 RepID=UPI00315D5644
MMGDREQRIRERAHQIWEQEGRPEGRHDEHWERAARAIDEEDMGQTAGRKEADGKAAPKKRTSRSTSNVGQASGLQPGGTTPGGSPAAGMGSMGRGGGSTAKASTGSSKGARR